MTYLKLVLHIVLPIIVPIIALVIIGKGGPSDRWKRFWKFDYRRSLISQPLFWACLFIPGLLFVSFGIIAWEGYVVSLTSKGLEEFVKISKLPLALLSMAIPFGAIAASFHSTEQTGKQISNSKNAQLYEQQLRKYNEATAVVSTINLVLVELEEAWKIYYSEYALELNKVPDGEAYIATYALGDNLFPIYDSAPTFLTHAPFEITSNIVQIHMRIKGLITTLNNNNEKSEIVRQAAIRQADDEISMLRQKGLHAEFLLQSRWQEIYKWRCDKEAHNLNMKSETKSLKNLTDLIGVLLSDLIPKVIEYTDRNTPAPPLFPEDE